MLPILNALYCILAFSVGNEKEGPLLQNFLNVSKDDGESTLYSVSSIYRPGMVEKKHAPYVKTTVDGIGCADINGLKQLVGIEVKTRVTHSTRQQELVRRQSRENDGGAKYSSIDPTL